MAIPDSPKRIKVVSVVIDSNRLTKSIDITSMVSEINIFENLFKPYLTGNMLWTDDADLQRIGNLGGTEIVKFTYKSILSGETFTKNFVIATIKSTKINDNVSQLSCTLIEQIGYLNDVMKISKSYKGTGEEIIKKIVHDNLLTEVEVLADASVQSEFKYIFPYITPFDGIDVILKKITTDSGLPYFLYSSLTRDKLVLTDLGTILRDEPFNPKALAYSQGATNNADIQEQLFSLETFEEAMMNESTLNMATSGGIGARYNLINATSGEVQTAHIDVTAVVQRLMDMNILKDPNPLVDLLFTPNEEDGRTLPEFDSVVFSQVAAETYPESGYGGLTEEATTPQYFLRIIRAGMLNHLTKNRYKVTGPGAIMTAADSSTVGNKVKIHVLNNAFGAIGSRSVDQKKSGEFIITAKRYSINVQQNEHTYGLEVCRMSTEEVIR